MSWWLWAMAAGVVFGLGGLTVYLVRRNGDLL